MIVPHIQWGRWILKCTSRLPATSQKHPGDISCRNLMTIQQDATPIWTKRIGEDSLAPCALICWLTAERQHCLFNVGRVRGHCIAFVRSVVEVTLSSGPSCCRQLGHATYIESNYPCQLITAQLDLSHSAHTQFPVIQWTSFRVHTYTRTQPHQRVPSL